MTAERDFNYLPPETRQIRDELRRPARGRAATAGAPRPAAGAPQFREGQRRRDRRRARAFL